MNVSIILPLIMSFQAADMPPEPPAQSTVSLPYAADIDSGYSDPQEDAVTADVEEDTVRPEDVRDPVTGELPVDPYLQSNENAGADPFKSGNMARAFHGQDGIRRVVDDMINLSETDPRIADIFKGIDMVRFHRTLFEQFCYILNAGCDYTGRNMAEAHKNLGTQRGDLNALVENLQKAMRKENVPFAAQNRFLSKLAPMEKDVVVR